jgi:hypothetical protein
MMIVYVVLHDNYVDQGVDFHKVFSSREKAQSYIHEQEPDESEHQNWLIVETEVI